MASTIGGGITFSAIFVFFDLLVGIPLSYTLASLNDPGTTFVAVNVLFIAVCSLWAQRMLWGNLAVWLQHDNDRHMQEKSQVLRENLAKEISELQKEIWELEIRELDRQIELDLGAHLQRELDDQLMPDQGLEIVERRDRKKAAAGRGLESTFVRARGARSGPFSRR